MFKELAVVIPAYNEEETIGATLDELKRNLKSATIYVVDDGSQDKTGKISKQRGAVVCRHILNRGLGATLATGIAAALENGAKFVVTFDADLQHNAKDVHRILEPVKSGNYDAAIGSRFMVKKHLEMMPYVKRLGNWALTWVTNILAGTTITDSQSGLRAFNRKAAEKLLIICDRYEVSSEIVHELARHKMRVKEVPIVAVYDERSRRKGTSVKSGFHILFSLIMKKMGMKR